MELLHELTAKRDSEDAAYREAKAYADEVYARASEHKRNVEILEKAIIAEMLKDGVVSQIENGKYYNIFERESVEITGDIPDDYARVKTLREPDKMKIRDALQTGELHGISWAAIRKEKHITIKEHGTQN